MTSSPSEPLQPYPHVSRSLWQVPAARPYRHRPSPGRAVPQAGWSPLGHPNPFSDALNHLLVNQDHLLAAQIISQTPEVISWTLKTTSCTSKTIFGHPAAQRAALSAQSSGRATSLPSPSPVLSNVVQPPQLLLSSHISDSPWHHHPDSAPHALALVFCPIPPKAPTGRAVYVTTHDRGIGMGTASGEAHPSRRLCAGRQSRAQQEPAPPPPNTSCLQLSRKRKKTPNWEVFLQMGRFGCLCQPLPPHPRAATEDQMSNGHWMLPQISRDQDHCREVLLTPPEGKALERGAEASGVRRDPGGTISSRLGNLSACHP